MRSKVLAVLLLAAFVGAGCGAADLKARKDDSINWLGQSMPDRYSGSPSGYGHPFRPAGFLLHPVGVALDWVLVKPFYMLAGVAPEWFGLYSEDAQRFQEAFPEKGSSANAPKKYE